MDNQSKPCSQNAQQINEYVMNDYCKGYAVNLDNCWNYTKIGRAHV